MFKFGKFLQSNVFFNLGGIKMKSSVREETLIKKILAIVLVVSLVVSVFPSFSQCGIALASSFGDNDTTANQYLSVLRPNL